jgi:hypothetical protein
LLLAALIEHELVDDVLFGSLNYETIFEQAMGRAGLAVHYGIEGWDGLGMNSAPPATVVKPHGSCNWVRPIHTRAKMSGNSGADVIGGPLHILNPVELEQAWEDGIGPSPVMSLYAPDKPSPNCPSHIDAQRDTLWNTIERAAAVVVIGASLRIEDYDVFEGIARSEAPVFYVGGKSEPPPGFRQARNGRPFERLGSDFLTSIPAIVDRLRAHRT